MYYTLNILRIKKLHAAIVIDVIFIRFGCRDVIISDQGSELVTELFFHSKQSHHNVSLACMQSYKSCIQQPAAKITHWDEYLSTEGH